jgi:hypothetical protein
MKQHDGAAGLVNEWSVKSETGYGGTYMASLSERDLLIRVFDIGSC